jgi:hypothetical protein
MDASLTSHFPLGLFKSVAVWAMIREEGTSLEVPRFLDW